MTITGGKFLGNTAGRVFFDTNQNAAYDPGEPSQLLTTSENGTMPSTTLTVPAAQAGAYSVYADFPEGSPIEASGVFIVRPCLTLRTNKGSPGATVIVDGTGFASNATGQIWFDADGDGVRDQASTEPVITVTTTSQGAIPDNTGITVPLVPAGTYQLRADIPAGTPVEASTSFTVKPSATCVPAYGVAGSTMSVTGVGFAASTSGRVFFDINGNGVYDSGNLIQPGEPVQAVLTDARRVRNDFDRALRATIRFRVRSVC